MTKNEILLKPKSQLYDKYFEDYIDFISIHDKQRFKKLSWSRIGERKYLSPYFIRKYHERLDLSTLKKFRDIHLSEQN